MNDRRPEGEKPEPPGRRAAIALAVAMHVLLAIFLIYGVHWQSDRPEAVEVDLVRSSPAPAPAPAAAKPEPPPEPKPEPKPAPKPEPKPLPLPPKPDIAIKEKPKPKDEPKPVFDPAAEMLKREERDMAARREADAAARELASLKARQGATARDKAIAEYLAKLRAKIRGNIAVPPDVKGNPEAIFDVTQLPTGEILSVRLKKGSGHAGLDAAIERAILKSSPLPKPDNPGLFERQLELKFRPLDE